MSVSTISHRVLRHWPLALLVALAVLIHREWFFSLAPLADGDWQFYFDETLRTIASGNMMWVDVRNLASMNSTPNFFPLYAVLQWLSTSFGVGFGLGERLLFLWPAAILPVLTSYAFAYTLIRRRFFAFGVALFFSFNTYTLFLHTGQVTIGVVVALAPLFFLVLHRLFERSRWFDVFGLALVSSMIGVYDLRFLPILFVASLLYGAGYMAFRRREFFSTSCSWKTRVMFVLKLLAVLPLFLLLNCYWIVPTFFGSGSESVFAFASPSLFFPYHTLLNGLFLSHPFWSIGGMLGFSQQIPFISLVVFPLLVCGGMLAVRREHRFIVLMFTGLFLFFLFFLKQNNPPLVGVYQWCFENVPGFQMFRESSKFGLIVVFSGSILAAFGLDALCSLRRSWFRFSAVRLGAIGVILAFFLAGVVPVVTRDVRTLFIPSNPPRDEVAVKDFFIREDGFFRVLWVPRKTLWGYYSTDHPSLSLMDMLDKEWQTFPVRNPDLADVLGAEQAATLFREASIRYIVVPNDLREEGIFSDIDRETVLAFLDASSALDRIEVPGSTYAVYRVHDSYRHIEVLDRQGGGILSGVAIDERSMSSTRKEFTVRGAPKTFSILLTDRYADGWVLSSSALTVQRHGVGNAFYNVWDVERTGGAADDDLAVTMEYVPQRLFARAGMVSIVAVAISVLVFIVLGVFASSPRLRRKE